MNSGRRDPARTEQLPEEPAEDMGTIAPWPKSDVCTIFTTEILGGGAWGGAERSAVALADWLERRNRHCRLVLYRDTYGIEAHANPGLEKVQLLPAHGPVHKIAALRRYFKPSSNAPALLVSGYQAALHATLAGLRQFSTLMHDTPSLMGPTSPLRRGASNRIVGYGLRRAARLGGKTIVTSEFLRDECEHFFGVRAEIVRMGGMGNKTPFHIRSAGNTLRMLSVSRIEWNKRIDWMLRSLAELEHGPTPLSHRTDWRLDIAGTGTQFAMLKDMAGGLGLGDRIFFHGFVSDETLEKLYSEAHLFLMPAVQGYGIPAIESLQRGTPVLLHRESGVSDILLDTPWATVLTRGPEEMTPRLREAIDGVLSGRHHSVALPHLPSEEEWAEKVARLSGWIA